MGNMIGSMETPGLSGVLSYTQALSTEADMKAQAKAYEYQAEYEEKAAIVEIQDYMELIDQAIGTASAATGASGFDASSESAQDPIDAIVRRGEIDATYIKMKGDIEAQSLRESAEQLRTAAKNQLRMNRIYAGQEAFFNREGQSWGGGGTQTVDDESQNTGNTAIQSNVWASESTVQTFGGTQSSYEGMVFY